jgi:catechol 2,3-dioxygenase-like lactoylglutathione lyase family enzyme
VIPVSGIHHFSITCADADRSAAFYREHFGMQPVSDRVVERGGYTERVTGVAGAKVRIVHLRSHGLNFELLEFVEPRGETRAREPNHAGSAHLCFITDDMDAAVAALRAAGVPFRSANSRAHTVTGGPNDGGSCVYVEDPDGNAVELVHLARPWPGQESS